MFPRAQVCRRYTCRKPWFPKVRVHQPMHRNAMGTEAKWESRRADSAEFIQTTISIIPLIGFIHIVDTFISDEGINGD